MNCTIKLNKNLGGARIAKAMVGRKCVFESRAWGDKYCAMREAHNWAKANGYTVV